MLTLKTRLWGLMKQLIGIIPGILSWMLQKMIALVFLLDRLICWLTDWIGSGVQRLWRVRRIVATAAVLLLAGGFSIGAAVLRPVRVLYIDGQRVGKAEQAEQVSQVLYQIEQSASAISEKVYRLPSSVELRWGIGLPKDYMDEGALEKALLSASEGLARLGIIRVDGQIAAICPSIDKAQAVLERVQNRYTDDEDENVRFVQSVRIDEQIGEKSAAEDVNVLYAVLSKTLDTEATREVTYIEQIPFETQTVENSELALGLTREVQKGQSGQAQVCAAIMTVDGVEQSRTIESRAVLSDAVAQVVEVGTKKTGLGTGEFIAPVQNYVFTSAFAWRWGTMHTGCDLAVPIGTPVYAADHGRVVAATNGGGYGNYVVLDHGNGFKTLYAHNDSLTVSVGDIVSQGERIALSGNTGFSTGPHLHFEVMQNDQKVDPMLYVAL